MTRPEPPTDVSSAPVGRARPPAGLVALAGRVEGRLEVFLAEERTRWTALDPHLAEPLDELARLALAAGKRLRPAFCQWGFVAGGGAATDDAVTELGAAFELFHVFALIHDDIIDAAETRRGGAAMHVALARDHAVEGLRGEGRRYGEGLAVLAGDLALVYADVLVDGVGAGGLTPAARQVWNDLRVELNMGQYLDVAAAARGDVDDERAWRILRYKSARYTVERPLELGLAASAGPSGLNRFGPALRAYGVALGEAFQLRDDLLGVFGETSATGKPVGDDLREGKPTPLLAAARRRATRPADAALLAEVGAPGLSASDVAELQALFRSSGALDEIESAIVERRSRALAALDGAGLADDVVEALVDLAWYVTERDR